MSVNQNLTELVSIDRKLDATRISSTEAIYTARTGVQVERFNYQGVSYIFKPCTITTVRRELWTHENLLPFIKGLRVPRILASGSVPQPTNNWIIYEDVGSLIHVSHVDEIIRAAGLIPLWHQVVVSAVPSDLKGHSPSYTEVLEVLLQKKQLVNMMLEESNISQSMISNWWTLILEWAQAINNNQVVSHGDYYRLNIAFHNEENIVLDWEFTHVNSVYWDLYSLMDITSYRYSHIDLDNKDREAALQQYWMNRNASLTMQYDDFIKGYYVFASVYSVWILTLIKADLQRSSIVQEDLLRQQRETKSICMQILQRLNI